MSPGEWSTLLANWVIPKTIAATVVAFYFYYDYYYLIIKGENIVKRFIVCGCIFTTYAAETMHSKRS